MDCVRLLPSHLRGSLTRALGCVVALSIAPLARTGDLDVAITEVHYNVFGAGADGSLEFLEVQNRGPTHVDVSGWSFSEGIGYEFPAGRILAPGEIVVLSPNPATARVAYSLDEVLGPYTGALDNKGEVLTLVDARGRLINRVHYDDEGSWPSRPDGRGPSLELTTRAGPNDQGRLWRPSEFLSGTPGKPNSRLLVADEIRPAPSAHIGGVINEIRPGAGATGFIELFNPTGASLDLSGHSLISSDFAIVHELPAGTTLAPGARRVFTAAATGPIPDVSQRYLLVTAELALIDDLEIDVVAGRSFGRFPDGDNDAHILDAPSPGAANTYTEVRTVVINEIHYHPPFVAPAGDCLDACSDRRQWIELHNPGAQAVDLSGWRLSSAVSFDFAAGTSIAAGGYLIVAANRAEFLATHPGATNVVGDWSGRLSHSSESIVLRNTLSNPVDRVEYGDGSPTNDEDPVDGIDDGTFRGSFWPRSPDGHGPTLELVHPGVSNRAGTAWLASSSNGGTPGARNSRYDATPDPTVRDVQHEPATPRSDESVRVTCRISSLGALASARLIWDLDGAGGTNTVNLVDDGTGPDARAGDEEYAATIPAQADGRIVRFRVEVEDAAGRSLRVPLEPASSPYNGYSGTYYLYEVDNDRGPTTGTQIVRIVMRSADRNALQSRSVQSDVLLPATFVIDERAYHLAGVRYRGENSRNEDNRSLKVRLRSEEPHEGRDNLNFNAGNGTANDISGFLEVLSSDLFRRADVPYPQTWPVAVHFPGEVSRDFDTHYIYKEPMDSAFLSRYFGGSDRGNFYRARDPGGQAEGDLSFRGNAVDPYRNDYEKRTREEEDDYSDIIELTRLFSPAQTSAAEFAARIADEIDVRQWARFFAVMACIVNTDGGIWNRTGEDYFLYRVPEDSPRPDAGKWLLFPWDLEETFQNSNEVLFRSTVPAIVRLFSLEENARLYYEELRAARDGAFSRLQMRQRYRPADLMFEPELVYDVVDPIDTTITNRLGFLDSRVSWTLEAGFVGTEPGQGSPVIVAGDVWRYFRGTQNPAGAPNAWTRVAYDDSSWLEGPSGFGYDDGDDATVLSDMEDGYTTVYIRREFEIARPQDVIGLTLRIDYDDAYVAYLNGVRVARSSNAPTDNVITFDMEASGSHEASNGGFLANPVEVQDLSGFTGNLVAGTNVLAIVGLNAGIGSSDFSLIPTLQVAETTATGGPAGGCGEHVYAQGSGVRVEGVCSPLGTHSVTLDGAPVGVSVIIGGNGPWGARFAGEVSVPAGVSGLTVRAHEGVDGVGAVLQTEEIAVERVGGFRTVSGNLTGNQIWRSVDGPFRVTNDVTVAGNGTLTIEPGTVVLFNEDRSLIVRGRLNATGTASQPIRFLAYACGAPWGGIAFDGTGRAANDPLHELRFVEIRDGTSAAGFGGCVAVVNSKVVVADSVISQVDDNAIDGSNAVLDVERVHIHDIFEGVHCTNSVTRIRDSLIEHMIGNSDAIDFDGSGAERSVIERCTLRYSSDDGIDLGDVTVDIRDNVLVGIEDKAISIEGGGSQGGPTITGNLVVTSGSGMALKNGVVISEAHHNTVANCQEGIELYAKDFAPDGGHATMHSTISWDNVVDLTIDGRSSLVIDRSDIGGGEPLPGVGNIVEDPQFVSARSGDYSLRAGSPCRGTGRDGTDMGAIPFELVDESSFIRGDSDRSGTVNLTDAIVTLDYLFQMGAGPESCQDRLDANDDGNADVSDAVYTLLFLFNGGPSIPAPYPAAGLDPTADAHVCLE